MNKLYIPFIITAPALLLGACAGKKPEPAPITVRLEAARAANGYAASYYSGTIEARNSIPLSFLAAGTVSDISVREGQPVEKGQVLGTLDCQSNQSALLMAGAKEKQAQDAYRRFQPMHKNGNLAEIKMVEIETARTQAEQALKLAQKGVADCTITAPTSGVISRRDAEPGSSAIPGRPVLRLDSVDQVYASISVPETEIAAIKTGSWAEVEISALNSTGTELRMDTEYRSSPAASRLHGVVADTGISADPLSRTYSVRVLLNNPRRRILPGMICSVYLAGQRRGAMTMVSATAVSMDEAGHQFVYIAEEGGKVARKRLISTAGFSNGGILVSSGLSGGEKVVSEGVQKLTDGARIAAEAI
ncbi:MAG TPA: efflux RND transporter periplasmic adaptor subunit [Elusimicrobiales bacterium]|nr:efflux RND transporter periplasmic adaptor subunit [Elusimicrobiales bacterium]